MLPRGISLVTKGMLNQPSSVRTYKTLPIALSVESIGKHINIIVDEFKTYNILKIDTKALNVTVLDTSINLSTDEIKKINIKRS